MMVMAPFLEEPDLGFPPHGDELGAAIQDVFSDVWPR
jgi:hypothetical protein